MEKLSNFVSEMNQSIDEFLVEHDLVLGETGGVYDCLWKCVVYFDAKNPHDKSKHKAFKAVLAGTSNHQDGSFIWSWGNQHFPENFHEDTAKLKEYGEKHEIPEFVERCLLIHPKTPQEMFDITMARKMRNFKDGFQSKVIKDNTGALYSRFTGEELFAIISKLLDSKMSSSLPILGSEVHGDVFIQDTRPLTEHKFSWPTKQFFGISD